MCHRFHNILLLLTEISETKTWLRRRRSFGWIVRAPAWRHRCKKLWVVTDTLKEKEEVYLFNLLNARSHGFVTNLVSQALKLQLMRSEVCQARISCTNTGKGGREIWRETTRFLRVPWGHRNRQVLLCPFVWYNTNLQRSSSSWILKSDPRFPAPFSYAEHSIIMITLL